MNSIYNSFPKLQDDLTKVNKSIIKNLTTSEETFSKAVLKMFNKNSKLIRPALCLIAASYNRSVSEKAITLAAAIEMMHVGSLIHDDIIDNAQTRRRNKTINSEFDEGFAVICGDYLFSKSFQLVFETQDLTNISRMGHNVTKMVFGEVEQYLDKFDQDISIERYFSIIEKKTASFFATSLVLGANLAKVNQDEIKRLELIGINMGILFQIQDDILDFSSEEQIGKSSKSDIKRGVYSLPIILTLESSVELRNYLKDNKEDLDFEYIHSLILRCEALNECSKYLKSYHNKVINEINNLNNESVKEHLIEIVNNLMNRTS